MPELGYEPRSSDNNFYPASGLQPSKQLQSKTNKQTVCVFGYMFSAVFLKSEHNFSQWEGKKNCRPYEMDLGEIQ